jgi:uncharacterized membrane protein YhaH (DUF805 family)
MKNRKITIGRSTDCDLVLADMSVSRLHAELELLENSRLLLTDCHSSQGSFVIRDGHEEKVKQQTVSKHDLLKFGNITIPVSEILTAMHLCEQDALVAKVEKPVQKIKVPGNLYPEPHKNPQPHCQTEETESFSRLFFTIGGRISRSSYWLKFMLPYSVIYVVLVMLDVSSGSFDPTIGYGTYSGLFTLAGLIPSLAMGIKRCHDRDRTGWFLLVSLIPLVNIWLLIELWFIKGTAGVNQYGPDSVLQLS